MFLTKLAPASRLWTYLHFVIGIILVTGTTDDWRLLWWFVGAWWIYEGVRRIVAEPKDPS